VRQVAGTTRPARGREEGVEVFRCLKEMLRAYCPRFLIGQNKKSWVVGGEGGPWLTSLDDNVGDGFSQG